MFGYVKVNTPSMRVREHELYRAIYYGLCRNMGKTSGQTSRLALSYDLVFLAAVRMLATGEKLNLSHGRCIAHPIKKRAFVASSDSLTYASAVSAVLLEGKLRDNITDEGAVKRTLARLASPAVRGMVKKAKRKAGDSITFASSLTDEKLAALSDLEREICPSLDRTSEIFGELMGDLFAAGLTGAEERICRHLGRAVGRFIYVCDAADDVIEDKKKKRYNPILAMYGDSIINEDGHLEKDVAESILCAALLYLDSASAAAELLCDSAAPHLRDASEIVRNILYIGMPENLKSVLKRRTGKNENPDTNGVINE